MTLLDGLSDMKKNIKNLVNIINVSEIEKPKKQEIEHTIVIYIVDTIIQNLFQ